MPLQMARHKGIAGRWLAGLGAAVLVYSLFETWYSIRLSTLMRGAVSQLPPQLSFLGDFARRLGY
jgi:hypothetical protein